MTPADSTTPVSLRAAQPYDHAAVQALLKGHGWPVRSRAGWDWAFSHNPARLATAAPLGWVLVQGDSLVGYLGNLPQTFSWRGETVRGATCTSYLVLPEHRSHSLGLMRAFFSQPEVQLFYTSTANGYSGPVYKLFKAKPWADPDVHLSLRWIASDRAYLHTALQRLPVVGQLPGLARGLSGLGAPLLRALRRGLGRASLPGGRRRWRAEPVEADALGAEWQRFWLHLQAQDGLQLDRSPATLRWRLADPDLREDLGLIALRDSQGEVLGLAQLLARQNRKTLAPRALVMDFVLRSDAPTDAARCLMAGVIAWAEARQLPLVECAGFSGTTARRLLALRPQRRATSGESHWVRSKPGHAPADLSAKLAEGAGWHWTGVDGDDWFGLSDLEERPARRPWRG